MERFAKIINGFKALTIFAKHFILDFWHGSEYVSGLAVVISKHLTIILLYKKVLRSFRQKKQIEVNQKLSTALHILFEVC